MALASKRLLSAALIVAALAVATGCGSDSGSDASTASSAPASAKTTTISTGDTDVGTVLTSPGGMTVYMFKADKNGESACDGDCAAAWPPVVTAGNPKASGDAEQSKLGTTKRSDGTTQVTYAGWPLYTFVKDTKAGQANGNEVDAFGAEWYALTGTGEEAEGSAAGGDASSSGSGY